VDFLACKVMPYAWGSRTAIAEVTGRPPSTEPEAELWMGAHPLLPAALDRGDGVRSLLDIIEREPERELGERVVRELGPRLPFLLKVLAAAEPLSLQAHPSAERARAGFDDEERRGIARTAPTRNYKDPSPKPELLCALGPFDALAGFRPIPDMLRLLDDAGIAALEPLRARPDATGLEAAFRALMTMPEDARRRTVDAVVAASDQMPLRERTLVRKLAQLYPGDIGIVSALLLQPVHLEAGEAIFLDAGGLHAYLEGTAVEIMASSDNVLRGGLTKKHVDVDELLAVLDWGAPAPGVLRARAIDDHESVYDTTAREFRLSVLRLTNGTSLERAVTGPEILFVAEGSVIANHRPVRRGECVFVPAVTGRYTLAGTGVVFRATTNLA
jgi:mannose-6-phosphate isomerase